ncbi:Remodeling and spacing factor 1 [Papilio xuthus]|uniref:Remodeling and spacing factor 1 n=1 Tax=Papilio xuthus TaxID=66420 RepID=A0A194Q0D4_PAPXU|nr:Remodeling and spacing factor 1 [Papilio xuthus]
MASDGEISCTTDPNFAVIYSFLKVFGKLYGLEIPTIAKLQELIENTQEVLDPLKELHVRLLRRALKSIQVNRWERALIKFCHQQRYHQEAWEIERFSYKKASTQVKLRILKLLLEYQFTCHPKFKNAVNALSSKELRLDPIGRDKYGCVYWLQIDHEANLCMYKEDQDEETWQLIASNREEFVKIISQLKSGEQVCQPVVNEDSSSVDVPAQVEVNKSEVAENEEEFLSPESESGNESDEPKVEKCKDDITSKEEEPETPKDDAPKDDAPKDIVKETIEENNLITNNVDKVEDKKDDMTITNEPDSKKEEEQTESNISEKDTDKEETKEQEVGEEVSEEIEEPVMIIKGEGNGEDCESSYFIGEEISEPVMFIYGDGWGCENDTGNPEAIEQEDNTELEENSDVDNPSEEVLNGEHANNVPKSNSRVKLNKSAKLKYSLSSVTKRSLRKQSNDNTDGSKSDSKKHCVRNLDKSNGSNSIATSSQRELRSDSSVHEKSTDCESSGKNKMKKIITKVKKREGMRTIRNNKEIVNSISEPESPRNSKSSIIEKRKSSVSSDHDGNASENAESGNVEGEETKVEDTLPPKKIRLESTPESDDVSHSKSETIDNIKDENIENNDGNTENDKESIINRKKIKANKGKLKGKKFLQNKIEISEISKDYDKVDVSDNKASKAIKRSLLNKSMNDKTRSESQSDSEDEEPIKSGKRLKFKPKKIVTKSRKKIEAKILEKCSSESEDETLYSLGKKSAKKVLKKKPKAKEKEKTTAASTNVTDNDTPVRQSRRIAQMKIKEEADRRHLEEVTLRELKMIHKKKNKEEEEEWQASGSSSEGEARARRSAAWRSDSTGPEPDSDSDEPLFEHHEEPELEAPRSDHEFSPESDLESGEPTAPLKLARTLQEGKDEGFCKRCGSGEQPEWILLCDRCDAGYHASCLAPVLLLVPEGDWFCPPCNHEKLISALEEELVKYDQLVVAVAEERERRRAEHPHSDSEQEPDKPELDHKSDEKSDGSGSGSGSDWSSSSSSGAVYRLRARRQLPVSYRAQEYDRLISSAIKEEYVEPTTSAGNQGRGKDISTIIEAAEEEKMKAEREARDQGEVGEVGEGSQKKQKKKRRRKPRKLNSLDVPSEDDDETDEDFKDTGNVSSMESSSEDMSSSAERDSRSSDSLPIIRPGRPDKKERTKLEDSSPEVKKKKKGLFEDSSSESADTKELPKKAKSRKRGDGRRSKLTQYDAAGNVVRARVTYGGLSDGPGPNDWSPKHRTRQRKINYTEMPNTESEDEMHKSSGKHMTDSSDEFRVTDEWDNSSSGSERAKRRRGEGGEEGEVGEDRAGEEQRRRALCDLVTKTAVVPLEKLAEHVTREKTE